MTLARQNNRRISETPSPPSKTDVNHNTSKACPVHQYPMGKEKGACVTGGEILCTHRGQKSRELAGDAIRPLPSQPPCLAKGKRMWN